MNIEHAQKQDQVSIYRYKSDQIIKKGHTKCQKCNILYDSKSEIAKLTCGFTCHIACLQNIVAEVS